MLGTIVRVYAVQIERLVNRMVNRCVVAGCLNTPGEGISLYKFPSNPALLEKWVKQVQRTRAQWTVTKYSFICSEHFTEDSFEVDSTIAATFGIAKKRRLKSDAVPTIFHRPSTSSAIAVGPSTGVRATVQTRKRTSDAMEATPSKCI